MSEVIKVRNEFANVHLELDETGNGSRAKITDIRSGKVAYFDALELECLAWSEHKDLIQILDPSQTRWADETEEE